MHTPAPTPAPDTPDTITIAFDLTRDDLVTLYRESAASPAAAEAILRLRRERSTAGFIALLLSAAALVITFGYSRGPSNEAVPLLVIVLGAGAVGAWWTFRDYKQRLAAAGHGNAAAYARSLEASHSLGPVRITLGPAGLAYHTPHCDIFQRWTGVTRVVDSPAAIFIIRADGQSYFIPARAFQTPQAAAAFAARARDILTRAGLGEQATLLRFLATNDAPCRACGYNLRGVPTPACPECGQAIDVSFLYRPPPMGG
jgi:hypothetical protein